MHKALLLAVSCCFNHLLPAQQEAHPGLREPLETLDARWRGASLIPDGAAGNAASFDGRNARIDVGPCPVSSRESWTLRCSIRTKAANFCTPLMARAGEAVGVSLVLGREPGHVSFEAWSWTSVRIASKHRIDDGAWHAIEVAYDPKTNLALLFVDNTLQGSAELGEGTSPDAMLRLGDNIGAHQPFAGDLDEVELLHTTTHAERFPALAPAVSLVALANSLRHLREVTLPRHTPSLAPEAAAEWPAQRLAVRRHVQDSLGLSPLPETVPLDVQVHAEVCRDGVRLQRISWVGFPGQRATGWLWLPDPMPTGRLPAILCPHGHWENGARHPVVQARCASFAKFGWIALAIDSVHVEDVASGVNSVGAMTWHNQRALDLLCARDDVDSTRIACTGASGGAQQTYYLMALEDRIAAAAPMVMACYFTEIVSDTSAHCGCNHVPRIAAGMDVPEMCAVFAPKPAMFGSVTGDWTHNFPREGLPELRALWASLDGPEPRSRHANEGHNYDRPMREEVYGFLHDVLLGPSADGQPRQRVPEPEFPVFSPAELQPLLAARLPAQLDPREMSKEYMQRRPRVATLAEIAPGLSFTLPRREIQWHNGADQAWRLGELRGDDEVPIPVYMAASNAEANTPFTVFVDPRGASAARDATDPWLRAPQRPVLVEPRPYGAWGPFRAAWQRNGLLMGRGEGYQAALDVASVCQNLPGDAPVHLVGLGEGGVVALLAAHLCPRIVHLVTNDLGPDYAENGNRLPLCPELRRWRDLPELIRTLPPRCDYELGGAVREPTGSPNWKICPPFSDEELASRLLPRIR
jgi:poly(3-hydroxybutyrate) depolymerase